MSILRFLLALSVVLVHVEWFTPNALNGYTILPGIVAVQSFFIISGFYMSVIINEKYKKTKRPYFLYITNRFLRIFPIYWVVLILTVGYEFFNKGIFDIFASYIIQQNSILSFFNILQHIVKNITIVLTLDAFIWIKGIYSGIWIPQSWTLILEVIFYLVAPFIVKKNLKVVLLLLIVSLIARIVVWHSKIYPLYNADYFLLPNFLFFVLGILSYKLKSLLPYSRLPFYITSLVFALFILFTLLFAFLPEFHHLKQWIYFASLTGIIPLLLTIDSGVNLKLLGDISYPIYISHFLVLEFASIIKTQSVLLEIIFVTAFSLFLHYSIAKPIDSIRSIRFKKSYSEDIE